MCKVPSQEGSLAQWRFTDAEPLLNQTRISGTHTNARSKCQSWRQSSETPHVRTMTIVMSCYERKMSVVLSLHPHDHPEIDSETGSVSCPLRGKRYLRKFRDHLFADHLLLFVAAPVDPGALRCPLSFSRILFHLCFPYMPCVNLNILSRLPVSHSQQSVGCLIS